RRVLARLHRSASERCVYKLAFRFACVTYNDQQKISILESTNTQIIASRDDSEGDRCVQDDKTRCPRRNSTALIRRFPSSWTSRNDNASLPVATTNSFSHFRISPGVPGRPTTVAEKIFKLCPPFIEMVIKAPGHGSNARIFRSIASAGSVQSILPSSRFSFGA